MRPAVVLGKVSFLAAPGPEGSVPGRRPTGQRAR